MANRLVIVGLLTCACGESPPPAPVTVPAPATADSHPAASSASSSSAPTPPPSPSSPPIAIADASAPTEPAAGPVGTCEAVCKGQMTSELESALQLRVKQSHRCYDNALAADRNLKGGKVIIDVSIAADGALCTATTSFSEKALETVASCMAGYFRKQPFPTPSGGGCASAKIPILLVPKK